MNSISEETTTRPCWFVGASYSKTDDQTERFLREGIWENNFDDDDHQAVVMSKSMQSGDRIAIKATYVRKNGLPFDNNGQPVSVMAIKATGTVLENIGDGHTVKVKWNKEATSREWYFFTYIRAVWKVSPGSDWRSDALIGFAFENRKQNINSFLKVPYWGKRYRRDTLKDQRFAWTRFYEAFADKLLTYRNRRAELINGIQKIADREKTMLVLKDQFRDGTTGPLKDICPFTTIGLFNKGITNSNRRSISSELAELLGVSESVPDSFDGIPVLNNQNSWFFSYEKNRRPEDIELLWDVYSRAISFADSDEFDARSAFVSAYDDASEVSHVGWKLTFGLYWIRPWCFPSLDKLARNYIQEKLKVDVNRSSSKGYCSASDYLMVQDSLKVLFQNEDCLVHSFPELSYDAWMNGKNGGTDTRYSLGDIVKDGCFIPKTMLQKTLKRLIYKKNLILQGPPGTGKTWLAKRLAYALIGQRDDNKVRSVQFHPSLSYEDFVRGWRPAGDGKLTLVDGPFIAVRNEAEKYPDTKFVMVIEEINRGNPAQIFGEMLTLLEADKRTQDEALELIYKRSPDERFYIPDNLYVIGTMNIADRSLALVDLALRRRFAFIDLEPTLGKPWRDWVHSNSGIEIETLSEIEKRIVELNNTISEDTSLGSQFRIGHAFITPPSKQRIEDAPKWYREVVETEIGPLLDEYWFENLEASKQAKHKLLEGF